MSFHRKARAELGGLNIMNISGADGAILKSHGMYEKVIYSPEKKKEDELDRVLVYLGPNNDFSEYTLPQIGANTMSYWNILPEYQLDLFGKILVVLPSPKRILTDAEVVALKKYAEKRKLFIFSGTNIDICNQVLDQVGSIFEIIPFASSNIGLTNGIIPSRTVVGLPVKTEGWLLVRSKYASLASVLDPFGKGISFSNIITIVPAYVFNYGGGGVYESRWMFPSAYQANIHYGTGAWGCSRNTVYPLSYTVDDWSALTKTAYIAWATAVGGTEDKSIELIYKKLPSYNFTRDSRGWLTFTDYAEYDWVSATMAFKGNIMVSGNTPLWLKAYDAYDAPDFYKWMAFKEWGTTDVFHQPFYNMPPYVYYDDTYIPPIQS